MVLYDYYNVCYCMCKEGDDIVCLLSYLIWNERGAMWRPGEVVSSCCILVLNVKDSVSETFDSDE